jgi:predicted dehydrogenase
MARYLMNGSPVKKVYSVKADNSWLGDRVAPQTGDDGEGSENLYEVNTEYDFPLMTWTHEDPACLGVWMRAERLNGKYDFMTGLSATVIGEKGLIEFLGEGGGGLRWDGKLVHLVLHRRGKEPETFRFDDEGEDDIWESEVSYYSSAHVHRMHEFVDSLIGGRPSRYTGRDALRDLRVAIASICSAREGLPIEVAEVTDERFYTDSVK